ncbi:MAG TPA: hypothetical protein VFM29_07395 [Vicinamibacteria bacterium]|nr:hypothetical protein [Vicinamibacteria bacterium]
MLTHPASPRPPLLRLALAGALVLVAGAAAGQTPPSPSPDRLDQDALDARGRAGLEIGSGARAYGMAGAFLARADDATAASWNPAGLSYLRRPELSLVGAWGRFASNENKPTGDVELRRARRTHPDFAAVTYPVGLGSVSGAVQLSFQRIFAFGGERTIETNESVREFESSGGFDVIAFGAGVRVFRALRVGATLNRWYDGFEQLSVRDPQFGRTRPRVDHFVEYGIAGWNANVGAIVTPTSAINLGVVVKTPFTAKVDLRRERTDLSLSGNQYFVNAFASDDVRIDFPTALGVGASIRPHSQLTLSADYTRTMWSDAEIRNYFVLAPGGGTTEEDYIPPRSTGDFYERLPFPTLAFPPEVGQNDTQQIRIGAEFVILGDEVRFPIRAGYLNDRLPNRGASGSSPKVDGVTVGAGAVVGPLMFDAAFLYQWANYTEANLSQTALRNRRVLLSIIYRHAGGRSASSY